MRERVVWAATVLALVGATRAPVYRLRVEMGAVPGDPIDDTRIQLMWLGLYALVILAAWPAWRVVWERARPMVWAAVALCGVLALSALWSIERERTIEQAGLMAAGMAAFALAAVAMTPRRFVWAVWTATSLCVSGSVWAHVRDWHYTVDPRGNFVGWYYNRNALGPVAALAVLTSLVLLWRGAAGRWWSAPAASATISAAVWWRTGSLTPLLAVAVAVVAVLFVWAWSRAEALGDEVARRRLVWFGRAVPLIVATMVIARGTINSWFGRSSSFSGRTVLWSEVFESYGQRPFGGFGFMAVWFDDDLRERLLARRRDLYEAHSGYLEVLIGAGVLGAVAMVWLLWVMVRAVVRAVPAGAWIVQWWVAVIAFVGVMNLGETYIGANIAAWLVAVAVGVQAVARIDVPDSERVDR